MNESFLERAKGIKAFFFDMDGVLTDGKVLVMQNGDLLRQMNVRDGFALKTLSRKGYIGAIISAGYSEGAVMRFKGFGLKEVHMNADPKLAVFNDILERNKLNASEVLYMGDDVADIECLKTAGIAVSPADASSEVLPYADYITEFTGGNAAVREVVELVLKAQDNWDFV